MLNCCFSLNAIKHFLSFCLPCVSTKRIREENKDSKASRGTNHISTEEVQLITFCSNNHLLQLLLLPKAIKICWCGHSLRIFVLFAFGENTHSLIEQPFNKSLVAGQSDDQNAS
ncbi:hypothetical protein GJ496_004258 [Pomphorhynchus laevis]|nr:hypothetical protein GJ496_004258 [Pomphorhynchus laevis]